MDKDTFSPEVRKHLDACAGFAEKFSRDMLSRYMSELNERLITLADSSRDNKQQGDMLQASRMLKHEGAHIEHTFATEIRSGFKRFAESDFPTTTFTSEDDEERHLSLVANDELEEKLAASSMSRRAETQYNEDLFAITQRLTMLRGGKKFPDEGNPLAPGRFAEALHASLKGIDLGIKLKIMFYKSFEKLILVELKKLYGEVNAYFIAQGILPNLRYSISKKKGDGSSAKAAPAPAPQDEQSQDQQQYQQPQYGGAPQQPSYSSATHQRSYGGTTIQPGGSSEQPPQPYSNAQQPYGDAAQQQGGGQQAGSAAMRDTMRKLSGGGLQPIASQISEWVNKQGAPRWAPPQNQPTAVYQKQLVDSILSARQQPMLKPLSIMLQESAPLVSRAQTPAEENNVVAFQPRQLVTALDQTHNREADSEAIDADHIEPYSVERHRIAAQEFVKELQRENPDHQISKSDAEVIDLVGMIFEYMLSDEHLPDPVKAVLSYMHTPYLKLAFLDRDMFARPDHPARQLLNTMADAGARWISAEGVSQHKVFPKIRAIVRRVLLDYSEEPEFFDELLQEFSQFVGNVTRSAELLERREKEKVQGEEKLRRVKRMVHREVRRRIDNRPLPSAVFILLLHPWSDYLVYAQLRFGEHSEQVTEALTTVDEVLWSIEPKQDAWEKSQLILLQEKLLDRLRTSIDAISYDHARAGRILDALQQLHVLALQNKHAQPATEEVREEIESNAVGHEEDQAALEDERRMALLSSAERELVEKLRMIEFGAWIERTDDNGKKQPLKIAWYEPQEMRYLLVDRAGKQTDILSASEIARGMLAGDIRLISGVAKPFFERALEHILARLNAREDV